MNLVQRAATHLVVGDGAMGTELQKAGLPLGENGEQWNLSHPARVQAIHRAYEAAGSEIVLTNSFGANRWVLDRYGLGERVVEMLFDEQIMESPARVLLPVKLVDYGTTAPPGR